MLYGRKRISFRNTRRRLYTARTIPSKVVSKDMPTFIQCSALGTWTDNANFALDLANVIITSSADYAAYAILYAQFKWTSIVVTFQPFLNQPFANTDVTIGMFGARQGTYETVPATLTASQVALLDVSMPLTNVGPKQSKYFKITRPEYYDASDVSTGNSSTPKITIYGGYSQIASTNINKGFWVAKVTMIARGRQR